MPYVCFRGLYLVVEPFELVQWKIYLALFHMEDQVPGRLLPSQISKFQRDAGTGYESLHANQGLKFQGLKCHPSNY